MNHICGKCKIPFECVSNHTVPWSIAYIGSLGQQVGFGCKCPTRQVRDILSSGDFIFCVEHICISCSGKDKKDTASSDTVKSASDRMREKLESMQKDRSPKNCH